MSDPHNFISDLVGFSPLLEKVVHRLENTSNPQLWISGSILAQTAWNRHFRLSAEYGISDIDIVYHDVSDLSEEGETSLAEKLREENADISLWIDAKNQARVHIWYEAKHGYSISAYPSLSHAIETFPTTASAVAIHLSGATMSVIAPFGLHDLINCVVRPNKTQITGSIYDAKVEKWRGLWPDLNVIPWTKAP